LRKRDLNKVHIDIQKADREIKFLIHWWEAVGFACNAMVWTSAETVATTPTTPAPDPDPDPQG
jgi:hypothetical protein